MSTVVLDEAVLHIPPSVNDLPSFRQWSLSDAFPEKGRISFLQGEVWVDMTKEQVFSHNQVKTEVSRVLSGIAKTNQTGRFFSDGVFLTNTNADISCRPDGVFVAAPSFQNGQVRLVEGAKCGFVELEGSPDVVIEVVSDSSVRKDTTDLPAAYYQAGIAEYWVIDARGNNVSYTIYRRASNSFEATATVDQWRWSDIFQLAFRLTRQDDLLGHPDFTLEHRSTL